MTWNVLGFGVSFPNPLFQLFIEIINNIARHNLIDAKYSQMAFRSARWRCSWEFFGNPLIKRKWCNTTRGRQPTKYIVLGASSMKEGVSLSPLLLWKLNKPKQFWPKKVHSKVKMDIFLTFKRKHYNAQKVYICFLLYMKIWKKILKSRFFSTGLVALKAHFFDKLSVNPLFILLDLAYTTLLLNKLPITWTATF